MNAKLIGLLAASEKEALNLVIAELTSMEYDVVTDHANYVFGIPLTEKITPVMYMAHLDTVRKNDNVIPAVWFDTIYNAAGEDAGCLGADDRAGVYIVLEIIQRLNAKPFVLFTTGEERGHVGASAFLAAPHPVDETLEESFYQGKTLIEPYLDGIYAIIQYDRRGFHDVVAYGAARAQDDLINKAILFGYKLEYGSTSDCRKITEMHGVAHLNLSAGFLHEHNPEEILLMPAIDFAINNGPYIAESIDKPYRVAKANLFSAWPFQFQKPSAEDGPPPQDKKGYMTPTCDICGKRRKVVYFLEHALACVCTRCIRRYGGEKKITYSNKERLKLELQIARDKSKKRNKMDKLPFVPSCPVVHDHEHIVALENDLFFCEECGTTFHFNNNGVWWWDMPNSKDAFSRSNDDPVTIYHLDQNDNQYPFDNCDQCGKQMHEKHLSYYLNGDQTGIALTVCDQCNAIDPAPRKKKR